MRDQRPGRADSLIGRPQGSIVPVMDVLNDDLEVAGAERDDVTYLDHAATTPLLPLVYDSVAAALSGTFGNPANSSHCLGRDATSALDRARVEVSALIGADPADICFTSGATEANNLAIRGLASHARGGTRNVIVVSEIEHRSVLAPVDELAESDGYQVRRAPVTPDGTIDLARLDQLLDDDVLIVAVHLANNEIGTIQPIVEIAARVRAHGALMLCDATQAIGKLPVDVHALGVDLLSLSAHKFHGPKGAGVLYLRHDVPIAPQLTGGGQEHGLRAGTPNVPAIVGMGVAARLAREHLAGRELELLRARRDRLERALLELCPTACVNGAGAARLAGISSVTFRGCCGAELVKSMPELAISRGSACSTGSSRPSHVLTALGRDDADAFATLRISMGVTTTDADVDRAIDTFRRSLSSSAA